ncbi:head GIN domain-containing protein [Sphingomonas phyllosphaerae]|uniref:head GIN domain-containing protein n=1 Tax=Sphingomonas phyllosphaerae TaxID=257003 RepID=UPI00041A44F4|nr:head GIN domain-containing protein [Sphingomonas phyllosphaerae]
MRFKVLAAAVLPMLACAFDGAIAQEAPARGSGTTRSYDVRDFSGIKLAGSDDVDVRVGRGFSVRAEGDPRVLDKITVTREGDRLTISRRWSRARGNARVYVTLPRLTAASLDGSGNLTIDQVRGGSFDARLAGSGNLRIAQVATESLGLSLAGSGNIATAGQTGQFSLNLAGSGNVDAAALVARQAAIKSAGSGDIRATVRGPATISLVGSGDVDLGGGARCTVRKAGSGTVRCGG